ncbi:MAG: NrsF family protein [Kofleriaceae bacterium]
MTDPVDRLATMPAEPPPAMSRALEDELARLTPVTTRRPIRQLIVLLAVSLAYAAGVVGLLALRRDVAELPLAWLVGGGLAWLLGFVLPAYVAIVPNLGSLAPRRQLAIAASIVSSVGLISLGLLVHPSGPSSLQLPAEQLARGHGCLELGVIAAVIPVVLGTVLLRRTVPHSARWIAAALGAASGSLGGLVLHLHCHITDPLHAGVIHGGVVVVAAVLSALVVPRCIDVR